MLAILRTCGGYAVLQCAQQVDPPLPLLVLSELEKIVMEASTVSAHATNVK